MKKSVLLLLFLIAAFSVYAITIGERIPRIQELPSERAAREAAEAAEARPAHELAKGAEIEDIHADLEDIHGELKGLTDQVAALRTTAQNIRTEQNVQISNVMSELSTVRGNTEELRSLRTLKEELSPILEKPQPAPMFLTILTIINFLMLCAVAGMMWVVRGEHATKPHVAEEHTHKELHDYIKRNIRAGMHIKDVKKYLVDHGWDEGDIDKAVHQIREGEAR